MIRNASWRPFTHAVLTLALLGAISLLEAAPRVLPEGQLPDDVRLGRTRSLGDHFPFEPPVSVSEWKGRSEQLRRRLRVALGLWPMPTRAPLETVIHGRREMGDYSVEKVYFQSYPGHFVTGNLYRPTAKAESTVKRPGVLCPHGHWPDGRFLHQSDKDTRSQLESGAEDFEASARSCLQARCVHLARMGCVVFHYDMLGYADSQQLNHHPRPDAADQAGFTSVRAASMLQTRTGLQTYNSIRTLDFLVSLPDVDASRIGVTGGSGGGTQTFMLTALDERVRVALPAVMVSVGMQGGCVCENAPFVRIDAGNVDFAALCAPRPLALIGADDWTLEIITRGYPQLKRLYQTLGHGDRVHAECFPQFQHNYNARSRAVLYRWFNKHLALGIDRPEEERDFKLLSKDELTVWNDQHPLPPSGPDHERALLAEMTRDSVRQLAELSPRDTETLQEYRRVVGGAFDALIGRSAPEPDDLEWKQTGSLDRGHHHEVRGLLRTVSRGEEVPVMVLAPERWRKDVLIRVHPDGKRALFEPNGDLKTDVQRLVKEGWAVASADLFGQGEFLDAKSAAQNAGNPPSKRPFVYNFGYNNALFARRVHDLLALTSFARRHEGFPHRAPVATRRVHIAGIDGAGHWVTAAVAQASDLFDRVVVDTGGFRFASIRNFEHRDFLPGAVRYGDLPGLLSLLPPHEVWLSDGEAGVPDVVAAAYRASGRPDALHRAPANPETSAIVDWLLAKSRERGR